MEAKQVDAREQRTRDPDTEILVTVAFKFVVVVASNPEAAATLNTKNGRRANGYRATKREFKFTFRREKAGTGYPVSEELIKDARAHPEHAQFILHEPGALELEKAENVELSIPLHQEALTLQPQVILIDRSRLRARIDF